MACNQSCGTCAFTENTGAGSEVYNRLRATICALSGIAFYCHHSRSSGAEMDWKAGKASFLLMPPAERKLCAGWQAAVRENAKHGYFSDPDYRVIRKAVGERALTLIDRFIHQDDATEKAAARQDLKRCIRFLASKDIADKEVPL